MSAKNNAINKPVAVSADLETIVGKGPLPRGEVTAKVWDYIKKHDLQAADDRRMIEPDDKLGKVIGSEKISMFKMTAAVSKHLG
ncbi:SWIB/MDM2 domain-containing protein [Croceicoccus sp. F390]|uniref:SWIB/MDM2 domain-containing protein n=1 Tax=Croceicoccus esteveae TaxID=3075597 RepID=A0ABU2ZH29_9SPHN|nr:SWIB/MDM2 domain-containing protein [Croceicoccus sp. F390]MDT0574904.1 SWIB/MDM2 domain-containing protein [Croceicoccus sp. F390]